MNVNNLPPVPVECVIAENNFLKHAMSYQNQLIEHHSTNAANFYQDALRWRYFKSMLDAKKADQNSAQVEQQVDEAIARKK